METFSGMPCNYGNVLQKRILRDYTYCHRYMLPAQISGNLFRDTPNSTFMSHRRVVYWENACLSRVLRPDWPERYSATLSHWQIYDMYVHCTLVYTSKKKFFLTSIANEHGFVERHLYVFRYMCEPLIFRNDILWSIGGLSTTTQNVPKRDATH